jgi:general secretion pathway protein D
LAGTRSDLENYLQTIETFDVDWLSGMSVGVYPLERVEAATVVPELEKVFGEGGPTPLAGLFRFMPIERINAVLVITPQSEYLARAEEWLRRLDRGGSESGAQLYVYYVKNVKAVDLGTSLTEVFGGGGGGGSSRTGAAPKPTGVGGVMPGIESVEIKSINNAGRRTEKAPATASAAQPTSADGISVVTSEDIRITAIEESNALMIRATPGEYDAILSAIRRLDIVPLQVHIEAKILQVDLTDSLKYGVKWFFENASDGAANSSYRQLRRNENQRRQDLGIPLRNAWSSFSGSLSSSGLAWTFLNTEAEAIVDALQSHGNVRVLSAPSLVVLNNKDAQIQVGQQIPVVSSVFNPNGGIGVDPNNPGGGGVGVGTQSLTQFRDIGIMLSVTPRVNPGGLVYMEISQEESTVAPGAPNATGNVSVNRRTIETEIAVQSGQTVMLGGLIKESESGSKGGLPGLSRIPLIGALFGSTNKEVSRQELLVLITPTVIDNADSARIVTDDYKSKFTGLKPLLKKLDAQ